MNNSRRDYPRTKLQIKSAFFKLMEEKTYEKIKVTDIVNEMGTTRQTFYGYYKDKQALFDGVVDDLAKGLIDLMKASGTGGFEQILDKLTEPYHPSFVEYFQYMRYHSKEFLLLLASTNETGFMGDFYERIKEFQKGRIEYIKQANNGACAEYIGHMYNNVMHDLIIGLFQWVQAGMQPDEIYMATYHTRMWVSYILLSKEIEDNWIYHRLVEKIQEKENWMVHFVQ